jgi:tripartite-type tricarboxylate transporter receptor subunit TctC
MSADYGTALATNFSIGGRSVTICLLEEWPSMCPSMRIVALLIAWCLVPSLAKAQPSETTYPERSVRIVVPFGPGGPGDVVTRLIAQKFSERFGKQFYIENRAGAGGNIGTALVAHAPADGYTLLVASSGLWVNPSLYAEVGYDADKDFEPVTIIARSPNVLVVDSEFPAHNVSEFVDVVKKEPGKYSYAMPGSGTPAHLSGEMFRLATGLDLLPIPFGGGGPMIESVIAGHTPIAFSSMPPAAPYIRGGQLRALAVTSSARVKALPDTPTMEEAGVANQEGDTPEAIFVPAGTPREVVDLLYRATLDALKSQDVLEKLEAIGFEPVGNAPEDFRGLIKADAAKWRDIIRRANIKLD